MPKGPERKRHNTLDFGTEKPSISGRVLDALRNKPSYRRLLSLPDGAITASKNPGNEIDTRLQNIIRDLDQSNGDKEEAFRLLKKAYEILIDVTVDQTRNAYFVEDDLLAKLKKRHNGDTAAIQRDYDRTVSERKARFVQDTQEALMNFAVFHKVTTEFSSYLPTHDYAVVPGVRSDSSSAVDQLLADDEAIREQVRGRTIPGMMPADDLEVPKIPQAGRLPATDSMRVPFRIPPGKARPLRTSKKTDPFIYGRPSEQNASLFDREELTRQHMVKAAFIRDGSFVGRLQNIAPSLKVDDSQPPSAPNTLERGVSEDSALIDFERLFVPLFQELLLPKLSENNGNFMKAVSAISKRTYVHAMSEKSPFCSYLDRHFDQGGNPVYRNFSRRVLEKRAKKARLHFNKEMHEYLRGRLNVESLRGISGDKLDYEVSQTAKRMFSILHNALVEGEQNLGSFIWLSYYLLEDKREEAIAFYSELYDLIHPLYKHAHEGMSRTPLSDDSNRVTLPDAPISKFPVNDDENDIDDEKTYPGIENIFDISSVPSSHPMIEEEPIPYSTKSDIPPRKSHITIPERVPSAHPKTLVPPDPDLQPMMIHKSESSSLQPAMIDDEITHEKFEVIASTKIKKESGSHLIRQQQVPHFKSEPSVIIHPRAEVVQPHNEKTQHNEPTLPSQRKKGLVIPSIPQSPRVPSFVEIESDGSPDAETVKRKPVSQPEVQPGQWSRWKARTKKRLGALALVAAAGTAAFFGIRSQQSSTSPVETSTQKTAEPPKVVPPERVEPAPTAKVITPPVHTTPREVGPKPAPTLDDQSDKMGIVAKVDLTNVRTKQLRDALTTGVTPDDGRSSYSSQLVNTLTQGQALSSNQTKQLEELRDKVNRGSYASAMKKWGSLPPHKVAELAAPGSTYEDRSLLRSFIKMHGDPAKWAKKTLDKKTGTRGLFQEVYKEDMEYYENHYEAEFLAYGMGDKGNIHTRKPNNTTIALQKDGRWLTYAYDVGRIVGYFEEGTKTGMIDRPSVPGKQGVPLPNIPGQYAPAPEQKYGALSPLMYPYGVDNNVPTNMAGRAFTRTTDTTERLFNPGSSKNVNTSFIKTGAEEFTQHMNEHPSNILRLSTTYQLSGGMTFWRHIENQIEQCGQSDRVKSAARRCLDKWRARGVSDLPFSVLSNDAQGVTVSLHNKAFLEDMTKTVALAHGGYGNLAGKWFLKGGPNDPRNKPSVKPAVTSDRFAHIKAGAEAYAKNSLKIGGTVRPNTTVARFVEEQIIASRLRPDVEKFVLSGLSYYQKLDKPLYDNLRKNADGTYSKDVHPKLISYLNRLMDDKVHPRSSVSERVAADNARKAAEAEAQFMAEAEMLTSNDLIEVNGLAKTWHIPRAEAMHPIEFIEKSLLKELTWQAVNVTNDRARVASLVSKKQSVRAICTAMRNAYNKKFIPSVQPFIAFDLPERWHSKLAEVLGSDWGASEKERNVDSIAFLDEADVVDIEDEAPISGVRRRVVAATNKSMLGAA